MAEEFYTRKELEEHMKMARLEGYDQARNDAFLAVKARADNWRKQDAEASNQLTTGFLKTRIAEDFECGESILRIGYCNCPSCRRGEPCGM